eukprot:gene3384-27858_t
MATIPPAVIACIVLSMVPGGYAGVSSGVEQGAILRSRRQAQGGGGGGIGQLQGGGNNQGGAANRKCRYIDCVDLDAEVCGTLPFTRKYRSASVLKSGCTFDSTANTCNRADGTIAELDVVASSATATCYLGLDPSLVLQSNSAALEVRIAVASATEKYLADLPDLDSGTLTTVEVHAHGTGQNVKIVVGGAIAKVQQFENLTTASSGGFSVLFGKEASKHLPEFLLDFEIQCRKDASELSTGAAFNANADGIGFLVSTPTAGVVAHGDADEKGSKSKFHSRLFVMPQSSVAGGAVKIGVGSNYNVKERFVVKHTPSKRVRAVACKATDIVWPSEPQISVVLQPMSETYSTAVSDSTVCISALYEGIASTMLRGTCDSFGQPCTANVTVPSEWFPRTAQIKATVQVFAGICDDSYDPKLSKLRSHSRVATFQLGSTMTGRKLPKGRFFMNVPPSTTAGTTLTAAANSMLSMGSFRMRINVDPAALAVAAIRFATPWTGAMHCEDNSTSCTVVASRIVLSDGGAAPASSGAETGGIFDLDVKVAQHASGGVYNIGGSFERAYDENGVLVKLPEDILFGDRATDVREGTGRIFVSPADKLVGIIPMLPNPTLMNTAALGGAAVECPMQIVGVYSSGRIEKQMDVSSLACTSSDETVVSVANCQTVSLKGTEQRGGSEKITISVVGTKLKVPQPVTVLFPVVDSVRILSATKPAINGTVHLRPVHGWTEDVSKNQQCHQVWQHTSLQVVATFSAGKEGNSDVSLPELDVTLAVRSALKSSEKAVVDLELDSSSATLVVKSAGESKVFLDAPLGKLAAINVLADSVDKAVRIQQLIVQEFGEISIGGSSGTAGTLTETALELQELVEFEVGRADKYYHRRYTLFVLYSDGSYMPIDGLDGIDANAADGSIVTTALADGKFRLTGASPGIFEAILSSRCKNETASIAVGQLRVTNEHVTAAVSLRASKETVRVVHHGTPAGAPELSIPQNASIGMFLVYADGTEADVSNDRQFIEIDESGDPKDLVAVHFDVDGIPAVSAAQNNVHGVAKMRFKCTSLPNLLPVDVKVNVVGGSILRVQALPWQKGVTSGDASLLSLIGSSSNHQQATLRATLQIDGDLIDATKLDGISFYAVPAGVVQLEKAEGGEIVVSSFPGAVEGSVSIYATFNGLESEAAVAIVFVYDVQKAAVAASPADGATIVFMLEATIVFMLEASNADSFAKFKGGGAATSGGVGGAVAAAAAVPATSAGSSSKSPVYVSGSDTDDDAPSKKTKTKHTSGGTAFDVRCTITMFGSVTDYSHHRPVLKMFSAVKDAGEVAWKLKATERISGATQQGGEMWMWSQAVYAAIKDAIVAGTVQGIDIYDPADQRPTIVKTTAEISLRLTGHVGGLELHLVDCVIKRFMLTTGESPTAGSVMGQSETKFIDYNCEHRAKSTTLLQALHPLLQAKGINGCDLTAVKKVAGKRGKSNTLTRYVAGTFKHDQTYPIPTAFLDDPNMSHAILDLSPKAGASGHAEAECDIHLSFVRHGDSTKQSQGCP